MRLAVVMAVVLAACGQSKPPPLTTDQNYTIVGRYETLKAADDVTIYYYERDAERPKGLILLFHQAGSSKGEYDKIGDRLQAAGYSSLAIDQRAGGDMFGPNETVKALGHEGSFLEAKKDLEAAFAWAQDKHLPVILWGSSYSASLVFLVAAEHPG